MYGANFARVSRKADISAVRVDIFPSDAVGFVFRSQRFKAFRQYANEDFATILRVTQSFHELPLLQPIEDVRNCACGQARELR